MTKKPTGTNLSLPIVSFIFMIIAITSISIIKSRKEAVYEVVTDTFDTVKHTLLGDKTYIANKNKALFKQIYTLQCFINEKKHNDAQQVKNAIVYNLMHNHKFPKDITVPLTEGWYLDCLGNNSKNVKEKISFYKKSNTQLHIALDRVKMYYPKTLKKYLDNKLERSMEVKTFKLGIENEFHLLLTNVINTTIEKHVLFINALADK